MRRCAGILAIVAAAGSAGCEQWGGADRTVELRRRNERLQAENAELKRNLLAARDQTLQFQRQLDTLHRLGDRRFEKLTVVEKIELMSMAGGADYDGQPGDDGVNVYVRPVDADGHSIKAAGTIHIELFDLQAPEGARRLGEYILDVDNTRQAWHDRLMTRHYTVRCPWRPDRLPRHNEITIRAKFTEYLTGRTFTAQTVCTVTLARGASGE